MRSTSAAPVGLLYQQLVTPAGGNRFETHLEISDDRFATVRADMLIANLPDLGGTFQPTIGDYANLVAVGKDFHGAFCGFNQPVAANFPNGITYLRNADFPNQRLLGNDGVTVRASSIDPFYVFFSDVVPADDVFVRDWTDSPTSFDTGVEPSIRPAFWATPDVWNRRGTAPGTFANDQPANEPAGNGVGNVGDNWAFARIRRREANPVGTSVTATAHFLVSPLGTGSNFLDASSADPDVSFPDPDPTRHVRSRRRGTDYDDAVPLAPEPGRVEPSLPGGRALLAGRPVRGPEPARPGAGLAGPGPRSPRRQQQGSAQHGPVDHARAGRRVGGDRASSRSSTTPRPSAATSSSRTPSIPCWRGAWKR